MKRISIFIISVFTLINCSADAQTSADTLRTDSSKFSKSSLTISLNTFIEPHQPLIFSPSVSYQYQQLYTSIRYNYEALNTVTVAGGYSFDGGHDTWFSLTPLFGFSFGDYKGISPELMGLLGTGRLALVLDGSYSISLSDSVSNLFLLSAGAYYMITSWMFGGVTLQRLRIVGSMDNVDAGLAIGTMTGRFDITLQGSEFWNSQRYFQIGLSYFFNPGKSNGHPGVSFPAAPDVPNKN